MNGAKKKKGDWGKNSRKRRMNGRREKVRKNYELTK